MPTENKNKLEVHVRWMIRFDLPSVLEIEQASFDHCWNEEDFLRVQRKTNVIGMVGESYPTANKKDATIVGYMIYYLEKHSLHLLNFAVDPKHRRRGVGSQMIEKMKSKLNTERRHAITLEVRETNLDAQLFFRSCGFLATEVLRRFYENENEDYKEDAYVMEHVLPEWDGTVPETEAILNREQ